MSATEKTTCETAEESDTKKCSTKTPNGFCDKPAVGVLQTYFGHKYICREHAKQAEKDGFMIDYENWRL
jgi:hypothetical protein